MENNTNDFLKLSALKQRFEHHIRLFASTPSINGTIFHLFLEKLKVEFNNDLDIKLVYDISSNIQNLNNNKDHHKVEYFISNLSITNVKTELLMTLILKQIDVDKIKY